ncbi:MAG: hypothetical protein J6334_05415 [Kiritimatiellae bacterium]|nr:hypothetical protein [Kiritimatiellia bacterium]
MKQWVVTGFAGIVLACGVWAAEGPVVHLPFDTAETLTEDRGSAKVAFVPCGGAAEFAPVGVKGGCVYWDGRSAIAAARFPEALPHGDAPWTVSAWVRRDAGCAGQGGWVSWGSLAKKRGNSLRFEGQARIRNYWNDVDLVVAAPAIDNGRWHQIVATWDGTRRSVYVDGALAGSDTLRPDIGTELFQIGRTMHDAFLTGWIDELMIFDRGFSAPAVAELYKEQLSPAALSDDLPDEVAEVDPAMADLERQLAPDPATVAKEGWSLRFTVNTDRPTGRETLLDLRGVVKVVLRQVNPAACDREQDIRRGNYIHYPLADGSCPVLEAALPGKVAIGVPLAVLKRADGDHEVVIRRANDGQWSILVDGEAYDEDGLTDRAISWPDALRLRRLSPRVSHLALQSPALPPRQVPDRKPVTRPIQFWTPDGHNTWVGDVVIGTFQGRCHVFYLLDRRHHSSKGGAGGHYFAHLSSGDLRHWEDHGTAVPLDAWWQTLGTGTPFEWKGKFYLAYGLHTSRLVPLEETCEPEMQRYFREKGVMGVFPFGKLKGYPMGGTYAVSEDGIHFTRSGILFHTAQNPTVYNRTDGQLGFVNSYGGQHGIYVSDHLGDWKRYDADIPIGGDCPCEFEWNGHHYLLQGFTKMAYNADGRVGGWVDWSTTGDDIYDGLSVPMVTRWRDGRRVMAGWIVHPLGWGGWLAFHELVQYPDGKLGVKWLAETPPPGERLEVEVPAGEPVVIRVPREDGGPDLEFRVDAAEGRAQYADVSGPGPAPRQFTQAELNANRDPEAIRRSGSQNPGAAQRYAVSHIRGLDRPYTVKLAVYYDAKSGCTLFDAEIAESRAMLCYRTGRYLKPVISNQ